MDKRRLAIAAGAGLGILLLARMAFGRGSSVVDAIDPAWFASRPGARKRIGNARVIEEVFRAYKLHPGVIAAALANSWAESGWSNDPPDGDGGHSVGLFQLNDFGGAGAGLTVAYRRDPRNNAKVIIEREVVTKRGKKLREAAAAGAGVGELAAIFSRDIERPADKEGAMAARRKLATAMWPQWA